jgi:hypothetical protein
MSVGRRTKHDGMRSQGLRKDEEVGWMRKKMDEGGDKVERQLI